MSFLPPAYSIGTNIAEFRESINRIKKYQNILSKSNISQNNRSKYEKKLSTALSIHDRIILHVFRLILKRLNKELSVTKQKLLKH